jgi:hypothetical protein
MQETRGRGIYLLLILNLGTRCGGWSALRSGRALPLEKDRLYSLDRRLSERQNWTKRLEEKSFFSAGDRTPFTKSSSL